MSDHVAPPPPSPPPPPPPPVVVEVPSHAVEHHTPDQGFELIHTSSTAPGGDAWTVILHKPRVDIEKPEPVADESAADS